VYLNVRLSNARRSVRVHALRLHQKEYRTDLPYLKDLTKEENEEQRCSSPSPVGDTISDDDNNKDNVALTNQPRCCTTNVYPGIEDRRLPVGAAGQVAADPEVGAAGGLPAPPPAALLAHNVGRGASADPQAPASLPPDLLAGQILALAPTPTRRDAESQVSVRCDLLPPAILPAPGLSIFGLVAAVRQHPQLSAGELLLVLEVNHGRRYTRAERHQLMGFLTTVIASERAVCRQLSARWDVLASSPDPVALQRLVAEVQSTAECYLDRGHCAAVDPGWG
jgi:hypothetical protein